ncbi:MAG: branched-chain amino acid ABC transporter permease [candidate division NC10 bacterium]|nr:branched-chain amino acid ABC transporter permease [candidate division NC10 bacterium]MBI2114256.1 branched-chain amino acid ABC transporter permease [candidate division NC10 bacterium]MBI2455451.1 branched-chain amino acid ABC transporter permease [candidate division NC10 bacterium]MBI2562516.1 branched-chain amino acid ABC transporter permease [candidate division NC10 bacterium]MBI3085726.1 branched-chain amino acid ABC transporter permease [candidate division NC10 bacterium]
MIWQQIANGIATGAVYALTTLGLTMVYGVLRVLHVAHAGVYALGAYVGLWAFRFTGNFWIGLVVAMAACALAGVLIERFLYAPLLHLPRIIPLIASIGLFIAMEEAFRIVAGPYALAYDAEVRFGSLALGPLRLTGPQTLILTVTLVLLGLLWLLLSRSKVGLAMRATAMDAEITSSFGVNTRAIIALNFLIGSAMAGAAGALIGVYDNQVWPTMGSVPAYKCLAIVVLGGLGNIPGSVLASFLIGLAETLLIGIVAIPFPRDALAFVAMILVLMFRPYGLLGRA